ncbi:hypothetical protein KBD18_02005 [Patescibacteria group bacterium]|nr:hypothetical protein [Patescibacteria group bacterium]
MEYYVGLLPDAGSETLLAETARRIIEVYPRKDGTRSVGCFTVVPRTCLVCGPFASADEGEIISVFRLLAATTTSPVVLHHGGLGLFGHRYCRLLCQVENKFGQNCYEVLKRFGKPGQVVRFPPSPIGCDTETAQKIQFLPRIDLVECSVGILEHMGRLFQKDTAALDTVLCGASKNGTLAFDRLGLLCGAEGRQLALVDEAPICRRAA